MKSCPFLFTKKLNNMVKIAFNFSSSFNCRLVSKQITDFTAQQMEKLSKELKLTIILAECNNALHNPASVLYIKKKMQLFIQLKIKYELISVTPQITKQEMESLIDRLNKDPTNTSTIVQLPFPTQYKFDVHELIDRINYNKNIDGSSTNSLTQPNLNNPKTLKPPTALGILALLSFYGIKTQGKIIVIIGKGSLVGSPLIKILQNYPYNATVITCDIFTINIKEITRKADIIISACGEANLIKAEDIKEDTILIDVGINVVKTDNSILQDSPTLSSQAKLSQKKFIHGDICRSAYIKSNYYTPVPGGVGLLTVASLAFNVLKSHLLQNNQPTFNLEMEFLNRKCLYDFVAKQETKTKKTKIMLLSSAYNGLTQKIDKKLNSLGYRTYFQLAASQQAMRDGVIAFQPNLIICPTLMKAIPEDIFTKIKCLIVHPGIKGDRGPSSIDWAILNLQKEWGVTILEADKEMDAGDIWATENFPMRQGLSKVEIYNTDVSRIAEKLVLRAVSQFENGNVQTQKLNYEDFSCKGRLHRTIRLADAERTINWETESTTQILRKARAADTQPGLKVKLLIDNKIITRFTYGYVSECEIVPPHSIRNGEIFLRKLEAVCVKTKDGAVWIQQMRNPKSSSQPYPFKVPSITQLGILASKIPEVNAHNFEYLNYNTFQEVTLDKRGSIGVIGFNFYNGAMSTVQCQRFAAAVEEISAMKDLEILVFTGSKGNWSNGINLNVIQHASSHEEEAWNNIVAINKVVKGIYKTSDKITISAIQTNAGAGGVYLALATDYCFAKEGVVLNPHYKNMGLYGSELHTATAASKFGKSILNYMKDTAKPLLVQEAISLKILDKLNLIEDNFLQGVIHFAEELISDKKKLQVQIAKRNIKHKMRFKFVTLQEYERQELEEMRADIFSNRNGFAQKRRAFVTKQLV